MRIKFFIEENGYENAVFKMAAILIRPRCVNRTTVTQLSRNLEAYPTNAAHLSYWTACLNFVAYVIDSSGSVSRRQEIVSRFSICW